MKSTHPHEITDCFREIPAFLSGTSFTHMLEIMRKALPTAFLAACIASCSTTDPREVRVPGHVAVLTVSSRFSGWGLNFCSEGEPVKDLYSRPEWNCPTIGGEIHVVRVKYGQSLTDGQPVPTFDVLVPYAVDGTGKHAITLLIEPASGDLAADTGVKYWARSVSFLDSSCHEEQTGSRFSHCLRMLLDDIGKNP